MTQIFYNLQPWCRIAIALCIIVVTSKERAASVDTFMDYESLTTRH
jgi:hypothetical protein